MATNETMKSPVFVVVRSLQSQVSFSIFFQHIFDEGFFTESEAYGRARLTGQQLSGILCYPLDCPFYGWSMPFLSL